MTLMEPSREHDLSGMGLLGGDSELLLADTILSCNLQAARILGYAMPALIGRAWIDLMPERQPDGSLSRDAFAQRLSAAHAGLPQSFLWALRTPGGREVHAIVSLQSVLRDGERAACARLHDLSGLQRAEQD